jgi:hypothetical protein
MPFSQPRLLRPWQECLGEKICVSKSFARNEIKENLPTPFFQLVYANVRFLSLDFPRETPVTQRHWHRMLPIQMISEMSKCETKILSHVSKQMGVERGVKL